MKIKTIQKILFQTALALAVGSMLLAQPPAGAPGGGKGPGGPGGGGAKGGGRGGAGGPVLSVTTAAWEDGAVIPLKHTFYGGAQAGTSGPSPAFEFHWWTGNTPAAAPATLQSYAVVFHDAENVGPNKSTPDTLHWSAFNIPGTAKGIPEGIPAGESPDGTRNGPGIRGGLQGAYFGPGAGAGPYHHYIFEFYALDAKLDITGAATRDELMKAMDGHVIGKAVYYARFANNPGAK